MSGWSCWSARWPGAAGERAALRRFQYACSPLAILVSSVHGQLKQACFLFVLAAFLVVLQAGPQVSGLRAGTRPASCSAWR